MGGLKLRAGKPAIILGVFRLSETMGFEAEGRETHMLTILMGERNENNIFWGREAEGKETNLMFAYFGGQGAFFFKL